MTIRQTNEANCLTLFLEGRLDSTTAPQLNEVITAGLEGITALILDLTQLEYISSAGLRVLLTAQNAMETRGEMKVVGANETIMEIFDITGFVDLLTLA